MLSRSHVAGDSLRSTAGRDSSHMYRHVGMDSSQGMSRKLVVSGSGCFSQPLNQTRLFVLLCSLSAAHVQSRVPQPARSVAHATRATHAT